MIDWLGSDLDLDKVPTHVGIIMDGNGRWANARGLHRTQGHAAGEPALFDVVHGALDLGVKWLTVYTFSTENWSRDSNEVDFLMQFNVDLLERRRDELNDLGVRVIFMGDVMDDRVPRILRDRIKDAEDLTAHNTRLTMVFAFNYGGRIEIVDAVRAIGRKIADGSLNPDAIDLDAIGRHLYEPDMPDPDLVIRTSGEQRTSNFLLWQAAYSEYVFTEVLWPDFDRHVLASCIGEYQSRERRFGGAVDESLTDIER
ncbi:MAG: polyprenyl diphosphate synthase [Actinomycetia bacterium]|nr:polyprenyl diphosphate synthase [Actinomycetes bacterium]